VVVKVYVRIQRLGPLQTIPIQRLGSRLRLGGIGALGMRRDEIVYAERVRSDVRLRERISDFRNPLQEIMDDLEPEACQRLRQSPRFIQLMADTAPTMITRIVNEVQAGEPPFTDNDFSAPTIARHKKAGYRMAQRALIDKAADGAQTDSRFGVKSNIT